MAAAAAPTPRGQAPRAATAHAWGTRPGQGTPSVFWMRELCTTGGGQSLARDTPTSSHSTRRSKRSAASNSAFMAAAHSSSSDFWGKRNGGQVSGEEGTSAVRLHPYSAGTAFLPQEPGLSPRPACVLMCPPCVWRGSRGRPLPLTHQDLRQLFLLSFLFHNQRGDSRESCVWGPGLHRNPGDLS